MIVASGLAMTGARVNVSDLWSVWQSAILPGYEIWAPHTQLGARQGFGPDQIFENTMGATSTERQARLRLQGNPNCAPLTSLVDLACAVFPHLTCPYLRAPTDVP